MSRYLLWACMVLLCLGACNSENGPLPETEDSPARTPEEELRTFQIEPGFEVQLVAAEPLVESPVMIQFDPDGRMWVVEMRGYMTDTEGSEEHRPTGSISVLEDTNGDGQMDKRTVYLDSLVMPRSIGFFKNGALVAANNSLWWTMDQDGDLKADTMVLLDSTYAANGLPEHTDNGLLRNIDNWYYNAKSRLRYRHRSGTWERDTTEFRGQWGIDHDDEGRLVYNYNWSQLHGDLVPPNYLSRNPNHKASSGIDHGLTQDRRIYPIRSTPAVNRGYIPGVLDSIGRLVEFTSAGAPTLYRSHLFPQDYYNNAFVTESAGNLIKRNVLRSNGVLLEAYDPNPGREFMASTDERFRPVYASVGPDGALYVVDMYHGIIQHAAYITPYLKEQTLNRGLDKPIQMGRVWRVVPKGTRPIPMPKLSKASTADLVSMLSHRDGWHRDMAQRLLVEKEDPASVNPLRQVVIQGEDELGSLHAMWTLEGLGKLEPDLLFDVVRGESDLLKRNAIRILEQMTLADPGILPGLEKEMKTLVAGASETLALQLALSSYALPSMTKIELLTQLIDSHGHQPVIRDAAMSSMASEEFTFLTALYENSGWTEASTEREIFLEMLTAAVVKNGKKEEIVGLLELADQTRTDWKEAVILTAMAIKAADMDQPGGIVLSQAPNLFRRSDLPIDSAKLAFIKMLFSWPGNRPSHEVSPIANLDKQSVKLFTDGRQKYMMNCAGCHGSNGRGVSRMGPPLAGSEWVTDDETRLTLLLLHGIEGPIEVAGKKYDAPEILPVMPSHSTMDDYSIAAILTYIRNEWGNQATSITPRHVGMTRLTNQGRVYPWSPSELNNYVNTLKDSLP